MYNKMKTKNYHTTPLEQFQNIIEQWYRETTSILLTHKYMTACIPGFGTDTSIKSGRVKLVLWVGFIGQAHSPNTTYFLNINPFTKAGGLDP
jgi:hypothetical protein